MHVLCTYSYKLSYISLCG
uniref:Uncharacterized protein n=1 Tax=Lepeophtheirus salmonis TaxID=72036 RepID=A0A0K2UC14_LEPSM